MQGGFTAAQVANLLASSGLICLYLFPAERGFVFNPIGHCTDRESGVKVSPMTTTIPTKQGQSSISAAIKVERSVKLSRWIVGAGFCSGGSGLWWVVLDESS